MTKRKPLGWRLWFYIGAVVILPVAAVMLLIKFAPDLILPSEELPVLGPKTNDPQGNAIIHHTLDFSLKNQNGDQVTQADAKGKVVVAGFFFASCATICPKMTESLKRVQAKYPGDDMVILYHSVDPVHDTVGALANYARLRGLKLSNWHLLTGDKKQIYQLARTSYFITAVEGDGGPSDFIHEELFALVDQQGRIRGYYKGTEAAEVDRLITDIAKLL